jgi:crotonobetainyl-CoA:carnitine CoA-transferase CaiB-like acyl-CoA transferase
LRGLVTVHGQATTATETMFAPMTEASNRGKRSVGLSLAVSEGRPILDELIRRADVFLTNYLPTACAKLRIDVDNVRHVNPDIVYVSGNGVGTKGPDRDSGAFDTTAFWARGGSAASMTTVDAEHAAAMPAAAYGDTCVA